MRESIVSLSRRETPTAEGRNLKTRLRVRIVRQGQEDEWREFSGTLFVTNYERKDGIMLLPPGDKRRSEDPIADVGGGRWEISHARHFPYSIVRLRQSVRERWIRFENIRHFFGSNSPQLQVGAEANLMACTPDGEVLNLYLSVVEAPQPTRCMVCKGDGFIHDPDNRTNVMCQICNGKGTLPQD